LPLSGILWTGAQFVFTVEGRRTIFATDAGGQHLHAFATVPQNNGEMRCVLSPSAHGFPAHTLYCHAATGQIYQIGAGGRGLRLLATIPTPHGSDGALALDTGGAFGYSLLAATGGSDSGPGTVYAVAADGRVRRIGAYGGPGGAENVFVAPQGFGAAAGQVLISIDKHDHLGRLLAMDSHGRVNTLVSGLQWGLNPLVTIPMAIPAAQATPTPGLYLADWASHDVLFAPAAQFTALAGALVAGTERHALLYLVRQHGAGYQASLLPTNLHAPNYNLEGAFFGGA
jgi:hypothetical protein